MIHIPKPISCFTKLKLFFLKTESDLNLNYFSFEWTPFSFVTQIMCHSNELSLRSWKNHYPDKYNDAAKQRRICQMKKNDNYSICLLVVNRLRYERKPHKHVQKTQKEIAAILQPHSEVCSCSSRRKCYTIAHNSIDRCYYKGSSWPLARNSNWSCQTVVDSNGKAKEYTYNPAIKKSARQPL